MRLRFAPARIRALPHVLAVGVSAVQLFAVSPVAAYCRTTTEKQTAASCPATCETGGIPLAWPTAKTTYAFNVRSFEGFEDGDLRRIIVESFDVWAAVKCETESGDRVSVGLVPEAASRTTQDEVGPLEEEPNDNAIVYFDGEGWLAAGYDPRAFALTSLWYYNNGEIIGADMHFNGGMQFGECPANGCSELDDITDLRNVATHEAGHYFGLAHSDQESATMWCDARPGQVDKRTLSPDDIAGLCDIYPPGKAFMPSSPADSGGDDSGCSLRPGTPGRRLGSTWMYLMLVFAGLARGRFAASGPPLKQLGRRERPLDSARRDGWPRRT